MAKIPMQKPNEADAQSQTDSTTTESTTDENTTESTTDENGLDKPDIFAKKVADYQDYIAKAIAKRKKFEGDDEDTVAMRTFMESQRPESWKAIQTDPEVYAEELRAYKLSQMSPEQKDFSIKWEAAQKDLDAATKVQADLRTEIVAKYPDFFGKVATERKPRVTKEGGKAAPVGDNVPFAGVMLTNEEATAKVKELVAKGVTSESIMIQTIYGNDFTITGSKPRFQIHSVRDALGLIVKK